MILDIADPNFDPHEIYAEFRMYIEQRSQKHLTHLETYYNSSSEPNDNRKSIRRSHLHIWIGSQDNAHTAMAVFTTHYRKITDDIINIWELLGLIDINNEYLILK